MWNGKLELTSKASLPKVDPSVAIWNVRLMVKMGRQTAKLEIQTFSPST
jgi:hypothetical protein